MPGELETIEKDYEQSAAVGVCTFLRDAYPDEFQKEFGGDLNACVRQATKLYDLGFDKWKEKYGRSMITRIKAAGAV